MEYAQQIMGHAAVALLSLFVWGIAFFTLIVYIERLAGLEIEAFTKKQVRTCGILTLPAPVIYYIGAICSN